MKLRLAELRTNLGITQEDLANEVGVTKMCISNWERGTREISLPKACDVANALSRLSGADVTPNDLVKEYARGRVSPSEGLPAHIAQALDTISSALAERRKTD